MSQFAAKRPARDLLHGVECNSQKGSKLEVSSPGTSSGRHTGPGGASAIEIDRRNRWRRKTGRKAKQRKDL